MRSLRRARRPLVALLVLVAALLVGYAVRAAHSGDDHHPKIATVALTALPPQAAATIMLIDAGGPFPYPRNDGVVFHNNQHLLPGEPDGYYHEYTVATPGAADRGSRRIITGRRGQYWYTGDHYASFQRIDVNR